MASGKAPATLAGTAMVAASGTAVPPDASPASASASGATPSEPVTSGSRQAGLLTLPIQNNPVRAGTVKASPAQPGPTQPGPTQSGPIQPGPIQAASATGLEAADSVTATLAGELGAAVVLPAGKPGTQQDPQSVPGTDAPAATGAGIPAGIPAAVQPPQPQQLNSTPAPVLATPVPQADPAKLLPQVTGPLFSLASAAPGSHVMTLKMSPEDLGPLTVRAHIDGNGVRIELFAPGEAGREAVRSILPELRRGLGESGFGASLDLSEHSAPADAGAGGAGGSDPRDRRPAESPAFPRGSDSEPVRMARTAVVLPRSSTSRPGHSRLMKENQ
ncbi:flagellar hook-length control protein FliK [Arthrobacter sp. NA-172]|uniref:flagellar hook-length control protein FliK n=1 Tax=Arthrobacter sp. NA-172 TaxID=3367524 RepID=UPI0037546EEC